MRKLLVSLLLVSLWPVGPFARAANAPIYQQRWFYAAFNLQVEAQADELIRLIARAARAGYNGLVLADYKFNILDRVPAHYFKNLARVKKAAEEAGIEIIPTVFPVGYSSGILAHDPNLAEGLPVKGAPFVVKDGKAVLASELRFRNGGLEETKGDTFVGFSWQDDPGVKTFADRTVAASGKVSCRLENFTKGGNHNARLVQKVAVRPYGCYRFECKVKTKDLKPAGNFKLLALGESGRILSFQEGELKATQDWVERDIVFNSLEEKSVNLYAGVWAGQSGKVWVDDLRLTELALVNLLRRPGCPLNVRSSDGKITYTEGKDYEPVRDAKLGQSPWAGEYGFDHAGAEVWIARGSRIREGEKLLVDWYHPVRTHSYQVMCCLTEPRLFDVMREQALLVKKHLKPRTYFLSHDEIRVANWCKACRDTGKTPGELVADNVRKGVEILQSVDKGAKLVVWSDMFDPHHNAVDRYYLVNGSLKESWKGLPKSVTLANWNSGKASASLKWFAERGHGQIIAGYYDSDLKNLERWTEAAKGVKGVSGFMYTTWGRNYELLEAYGKAMQPPTK